jgi:hypothetical protein
MLSLITIDGLVHEATAGERLIDLLNRSEIKLPQVCYHSQALLGDLTRAVPKALVQANARKGKPPGLIELVSTFWRNKDFRRGLAAFNDLLEMFGRNLAAKVPEQK